MLLAIRGGSFPSICRRPPLRESGIAGLFKRLLRRPPDLHNRSVPRLSRLHRLASPWLSPPRPRRKRKRRQRRSELQTPYPSFPYQPGNPLMGGGGGGGAPLKRKKLKKTKKLAGSKSQGNDPPNEAQLFAMMRLMAAKHGWSVEDQARPFGPYALPSTPPTAPPPAPHTPAYPVPGMSHISRALAALGAPPGEESFALPMGPPPPPAREQGYTDPLSALSSKSDWSSLPESSASDADVWSVTSTAPALSEAEAPPALRHLSEEAEAPLLRYLGEFYSVPADPAASQPQGSRLFRADAAPSPGIPLTADFIAEYDRIANEPTPTPRASGFRRSFLFQPKDTEKYLSRSRLSARLSSGRL